jgi:ketol-acid reductoisomerase
MATVYTDADASLEALKGKTVAILGYGSQGHAQALNLRDSGVEVIIGVRPGFSWERAASDGFPVMSIPDAVQNAEVLMLLINDEAQPRCTPNRLRPPCVRGIRSASRMGSISISGRLCRRSGWM